MNKQVKSTIYSSIAIGVCLLIGVVTMRGASAKYSTVWQLQADTTGSISGVVIAADTDVPLSAVSVTLYDAASRFSFPVHFGTTDEDGSYLIEGVAPGNYLVEFTPSAMMIYQSAFYDNGAIVEVVAGQRITASASLPREGLISGTVTDESTTLPLSDVQVLAYTYGQREPVAETVSDSNGNYTLAARDGETVWLIFEPNQNGPNGRYLPYYHLSAVTVEGAGQAASVNAPMQVGGQIMGTVTDGANGAPIDQVQVDLLNEDGIEIDMLRTDAEGQYETAGLRPGRYYLLFSKRSGFNRYFDQYYADSIDFERATPIVISGSETKSGTDVALSLRASAGNSVLSGRVVDATTNEPLSEIRVTLYDADGTWLNAAQTLDSGDYTFTNLIEGDYVLYFSAEQGFVSANFIAEYYNDASTLEEAELVRVGDEDSRTDVDVALQPGGSIGGVVTSGTTGQPLPSVLVELLDSGGNRITQTPTDADGAYSFAQLKTDSYLLKFSPSNESATYLSEFYNDAETPVGATRISVVAPNVIDSVSVSLQRGSLIAGNIRAVEDTERGLADVGVIVYPVAGCEPVAQGTTNLAGFYETSPALPAGEYRVAYRPLASGKSGAYLPAASTDSIQISQPRYVNDVDAELTLGAVIYGRVVGSDSGLPLDEVRIQVDGGDESSVVGSFSTNAAGLYASHGLPTADHVLKFNQPSSGENLASLYSFELGESLAASAGTRLEYNDVLRRGGHIAGYVVARDTSEPIADVLVALYDAQSEEVLKFALTAEDGRYAFRGLVDGEYKVQFRSEATSAAYVWAFYGGDSGFESGAVLTIESANSIEDIGDDLGRGGQIAGTILDENSQPLSMASAVVFDLDGNLVGQGTTDAMGQYVTNGVSAGAKVVRFLRTIATEQCGTEVMQFYYDNQIDFDSATQVNVEQGAVASGVDALMDPSAPPTPAPTQTPTQTPTPQATATPIATSTPALEGSSNYLPLINR